MNPLTGYERIESHRIARSDTMEVRLELWDHDRYAPDDASAEPARRWAVAWSLPGHGASYDGDTRRVIVDDDVAGWMLKNLKTAEETTND